MQRGGGATQGADLLQSTDLAGVPSAMPNALSQQQQRPQAGVRGTFFSIRLNLDLTSNSEDQCVLIYFREGARGRRQRPPRQSGRLGAQQREEQIPLHLTM